MLLLRSACLLHLTPNGRGRGLNLAAELPFTAELPQILVDDFYFRQYPIALPLPLVQLLPPLCQGVHLRLQGPGQHGELVPGVDAVFQQEMGLPLVLPEPGNFLSGGK